LSQVFKKHERYWSGIAIYGDYKPWKAHKEAGGDRSNFPEHSGRALDLKDGKQEGINYFKAIIEPELADKIVIVTVPSHDPAKPSLGTKKLAAALAENGERINGADCLGPVFS